MSKPVRNVVCRGYRYAKHGKPTQVLKKEEWVTPFDRSGDKVVVRMIASPVQNNDKWLIHGKCGNLRPASFPAVAGTEGVGEVEEVGSKCQTVKPGDYVVFNRHDVGTWSTNVVAPEASVDRVPNDIQPEHLSMLHSYGAAWRMVNDYGRIKPDDVVFVLGLSADATAVASLLQERGATVFLVLPTGIANETPIHDTYRRLLPSGTTIKDVLLRQRAFQNVATDLPRVSWIFNGVGGETLRESTRYLAEGAKVVSFGNSSRQPLSVSVGRLLFQGVEMHNFCYSRFLAASSREEREDMYKELCTMLRTGMHANPYGNEMHKRPQLFSLLERYEFDRHFHAAWNHAFQISGTRKPVLRFGEQYDWTHSGDWHKEAEYFSDNKNMYLEGLGQPADFLLKRHQGTIYGAAGLVANLMDTHQTADCDAFRAKHDMREWDTRQDFKMMTEHSCRRHLELEAKIYNFSYHIKDNSTPEIIPAGITQSWYPEDDLYFSRTSNSGRTVH